MRRLLIPVLAVLLLGIPAPAHAQTVQTGDCAPGVPNALDLSGIYISPEWRMRITIYPCGVAVLWANDFGMHGADYRLIERAEGGLLISRIAAPGVSLDNRTTIGVKPAEPGFIQAVTVSPFGDDFKVYRLRKI